MSNRVDLVLCWHMHQPDYRVGASGDFTLPWTFLHAIKDYTDMIAHLEAHPQARVVFNFVPVLLDQLEDYAQQFRSGELRDPLLRLLATEDLSTLGAEQRRFVLDTCFRGNHEKMLQPFRAYRRLHEMAALFLAGDRAGLDYLSDQYFADLLTWYHLSWTGETVRRDSDLVARLLAKESGFGIADRRALVELCGQLVLGVVARYQRLNGAGRIELSTTPHYHPIVPLLVDFASAREAWPQVELPRASGYPGGMQRAQFHLESALRTHVARFGETARGMWPAEGALSEATARLFAANGASWTASSERVLYNSLRAAHESTLARESYLYSPYRFSADDHSIACFFRDDRLSDKIGFEYSKWHAGDAVADFIHDLEQIGRAAPQRIRPVVSVILDGENPWEYYPYNGYYFLSELYARLSEHPSIRMRTFRELVSSPDFAERCRPLTKIAAGSWVYGTFSTWIGSPQKNKAWDLLCDAKREFDLAITRLSAAQQQRAYLQLAVCEGSDWFWWFGDYNPAAVVRMFDELFRKNLANLYRCLHLSVPAELEHPIGAGMVAEAELGGAMRRSA